MRTVAQKHQANHHPYHSHTRPYETFLPFGSAIKDVTTCKYSSCNSSRMYSCTSCNCNTVSTERDLKLVLVVLVVLVVLPLDNRIISQPCKSNAGGGSGGKRQRNKHKKGSAPVLPATLVSCHPFPTYLRCTPTTVRNTTTRTSGGQRWWLFATGAPRHRCASEAWRCVPNTTRTTTHARHGRSILSLLEGQERKNGSTHNVSNTQKRQCAKTQKKTMCQTQKKTMCQNKKDNVSNKKRQCVKTRK